MCLHIVFGELNQIFFVFAEIRQLFSLGTLQPAVLGPRQSQPHSPTGMYCIEQTLTGTVMIDSSQQFETIIRVAQAITVCQEKYLVIDFCGKGTCMDHQPAFFFQVTVSPNIVITRKKMHFDTHISQFGELAEKTCISFRNNITIFIPKVEHIAQKVDCGSLILDAVEESHQSTLLHPSVLNSQRAQMCVRKKINLLHSNPSSTLASSLIIL